MRDLITDLLESERLPGGHAALHTDAVDLNAVVRDVVGARAITLRLDPHLATMALDATRIKLLLRNLIDNALRHGASAPSPPLVTTAFDVDALTLTERDHGPGVDDAQLTLLAQAFRCPDSARQRATGCVGLGLYLCRLIAQAHGGSLDLRNAQPWLELIVRLPRRLTRTATASASSSPNRAAP